MESESRDETLGNGNHFLNLLRTETSRLNGLIYSAEHELENDETIPEDSRGKLRIAVGKGKMLLKKKFTQFEELCLKNLGVESEIRYTVTAEDLAGYWDTIVIQVVQVYKIFDEVDVWRKNNWKEPKKNQTRQKKLKEEKVILREDMGKTEINAEMF